MWKISRKSDKGTGDALEEMALDLFLEGGFGDMTYLHVKYV